jgi:hypothetical protein
MGYGHTWRRFRAGIIRERSTLRGVRRDRRPALAPPSRSPAAELAARIRPVERQARLHRLPRPGEPAAGRLVRYEVPEGLPFGRPRFTVHCTPRGKVANVDSDDGAEFLLRGGKKCLFDTRDDV